MGFAQLIKMDRGFNVLTILYFIAFAIAIMWMQQNNIRAGNIYVTLIVISVLVLIAALFLKRSQSIVIPVEKKTPRAALGFVIAFSFIMIIALLFHGFGIDAGFSFLQNHARPLNFALVGEGPTLTFTQLSATQDPLFNVFTVAVGGGVGEEIAFMLFFIAALLLLSGLLNTFPQTQFDTRTNFVTAILLALVVIGILFSYLHNLSPLYQTTQQFVVAMLFRIAVTAAAFFALGITAAIGFHMAINMTFLGFDAIINAFFFSGFNGFLFFLLFILPFVIVLAHANNLKEAFGNLRDFKFTVKE